MKLYLFVLSVISKFDFNTLTALNGYFALQFGKENIHKPLIAAYFTGNVLSITLLDSLKNQFSVFVILKYSLFLNWILLLVLFGEIEVVAHAALKYWLAVATTFALACSNLIMNGSFAALTAQMQTNNILINMTGSGVSAVLSNLILLGCLFFMGEANPRYFILLYLGIATIAYIYLLSQYLNFEKHSTSNYEISLFIQPQTSLVFRRSLVDIKEDEQPKSDKLLLSEISNLVFGLFFVFFVFIGCFPGLVLQYDLGFQSISNDAILATIVNLVSVLPRLYLHFHTIERNIDNYVHIITLLRFGFFKLFKVLVKDQSHEKGTLIVFLITVCFFAATTGFNLTYYTARASADFSNQQNKARSGVLSYYATILGMFCGSLAASLL